MRIGRTMDWPELAPLADRKHLLDYMYDAVFALAPVKPQSSGSSPLAG